MRIRALESLKAGLGKRRVLSMLAAGGIPSYWWAGQRNFGDLVTPYLVRRITGRTAINTHGLDLGSVDVLCSTGSILHGLRSGNYTVWGSGFIKPIDRSTAIARLHALRGPLSGEVAKGLGWQDPGKYGDPALLLPLLVPAGNLRTRGKVVVVPHYALLDSTSSTHPEACVVSPMQEVEEVASCISDAELVIASSLHGLIVAQAYGRPWVWLRDHRDALHGGDFKFHDFFSSLGVSPQALECDGILTPPLVEKARSMATLASPGTTRARQRDLLSSAPGILYTQELSSMKTALQMQEDLPANQAN